MNEAFTKKSLRIPSENHTLAGSLFLPTSVKKDMGVLFLHGGGQAAKERYIELQRILAEHGYVSLSIDFRGVGESSGAFEEGSLANRLTDAIVAVDELKKYTSQIAVIGCSMGGHVAARLVEKRHIEKLILLYAAAYALEAEHVPLGEEFTAILRRERSWEHSPAFTDVKHFKGDILIMYGEKDAVIPQDVQLAYKQSMHADGKFVVLPNAQHLYLAPKNEVEMQAKEKAHEEILTFLYN